MEKLYMYAVIENIVTIIATLILCYMLKSAWGLLFMLNINSLRKQTEDKEDGKQ